MLLVVVELLRADRRGSWLVCQDSGFGLLWSVGAEVLLSGAPQAGRLR